MPKSSNYIAVSSRNASTAVAMFDETFFKVVDVAPSTKGHRIFHLYRTAEDWEKERAQRISHLISDWRDRADDHRTASDNSAAAAFDYCAGRLQDALETLT